MAGNDEKKKALDAAIAKLEKDFGKGAVMKLGESGAHVAVETVPTGCLSLDIALGLGGVPKGRVIEVTDLSPAVRQRLALHMIWRKCRNAAVLRDLLMRNMRWIRSMQRI